MTTLSQQIENLKNNPKAIEEALGIIQALERTLRLHQKFVTNVGFEHVTCGNIAEGDLLMDGNPVPELFVGQSVERTAGLTNGLVYRKRVQ